MTDGSADGLVSVLDGIWVLRPGYLRVEVEHEQVSEQTAGVSSSDVLPHTDGGFKNGDNDLPSESHVAEKQLPSTQTHWTPASPAWRHQRAHVWTGNPTSWPVVRPAVTCWAD
ncbi:hypothetical protein EYF80_030257 [Liparis tanakae]|uniref:Uncharacterized protein n=1 Tax=Liparis tanakae TaxID=230148 RepID=A0A4Z2H368_9TELE|nr:hypothetical protein EYF80_030257 [Liparis tanakae]